MCGIAGFAGFELNRTDAQERIGRMCDAILHRGPDSAGYLVLPEITMGMRRLSIIDVAGGTQPIFNEDGAVSVVFNGEIYNHHELRRRLQGSGHTFKTRSDTEVLVHLYEELGTHMVAELHGMFAFSIWDSRRKQLLIARDRTGMKPLYYAEDGRSLTWFSELRSLLAGHPPRPAVSTAAIMQYLAFGYIPDPGSIFEGVYKLPPGHLMVWSARRGVEISRYWSPLPPGPPPADEAAIVDVLKKKLSKAVESHLESEVPLGAFLSGGLDSSTVVSLMSRYAKGRVKTFTIGFGDPQYDESSAAREVAGILGTEHTELRVEPDVDSLFETIAAMFDEPFGDSSAIPSFLVAQLARKSVTVALSGDGGDELFGGYTRYQQSLRNWSVPPPLALLLRTTARMLPHGFLGRNRLIDLGRSRWGRYAAQVVQPVRLDEGGVGAVSASGALTAVSEQIADRLPVGAEQDFAAALMRVDIDTYLPGDILTKVDRVTMAVSLEARVPLLDADLVDYALQVPSRFHLDTSESKRLLRKAVQDIVPSSVLNRPKQGFAIPLAPWFRGPLQHRVNELRSPTTRLSPYVDAQAVSRILDEHTAGRRDHSAMIWRMIVLNYWLAALQSGHLARPPDIKAAGVF